MDLASLAQAVNPIIQTVFIVVIGLGYYYTTKAIRSQAEEMARETTTGGRPLIIVSEDYENLPTALHKKCRYEPIFCAGWISAQKIKYEGRRGNVRKCRRPTTYAV